MTWTVENVQPRWRFALEVTCEACGAKPGDLCWKNNGSLRRTPHGPRRGRPDRDWPKAPGEAKAKPGPKRRAGKRRH